MRPEVVTIVICLWMDPTNWMEGGVLCHTEFRVVSEQVFADVQKESDTPS